MTTRLLSSAPNIMSIHASNALFCDQCRRALLVKMRLKSNYAKVLSLDQPAEYKIDARGKPALAAAEVLAAQVLYAVNSFKSIPERSNGVLIHLDTLSLLMAL
ncbi:hypothetical protein PoB_002044100 [Plakobranchus ocellatus]|uniref:Uncharacterized protein n=1 Tax=Plakobranchus ocellatus TaxID=259542 RepID=A0AAV3Z3Q6_9GAST|nr:hypothetical protein PoB_002044100 [Plakobranchus ocellatus]